jgi:hypothetical protein
MAGSERAEGRAATSSESFVSTSDALHSRDVVDRDRSPADALDAEAAYYSHRAVQEEQALGPGYYVDLLRGMATDRAAMAQRLRTGVVLRTSSVGRLTAPPPSRCSTQSKRVS